MNEEMILPIVYGVGAAVLIFLVIFGLTRRGKAEKPEMTLPVNVGETRHGDGIKRPMDVREGIYDTDQAGFSAEEDAKAGDSVDKINEFDD